MSKRNMPSKSEIINYWSKIIHDLPQQEDICWGCGFPSGTERCHVIPRQEIKSDTVSNIVLLCKQCHIAQEVDCKINGYEKFIEKIKYGAPYMSAKIKYYEAIYE